MLALDVGRERDLADAVGDGDDVGRGVAGEAHARRALGVFFEHGAGERPVDAEGRADRKFFSGAHEAPPDVFVAAGGGAQEQALDRAAGRAVCEQARGQHGGGVAEQRVAGPQVFAEIGEHAVLDAAGGAMHDEQARGVAARGGRLGDEPLGQRVVEEVGGKRGHGRRKTQPRNDARERAGETTGRRRRPRL